MTPLFHKLPVLSNSRDCDKLLERQRGRQSPYETGVLYQKLEEYGKCPTRLSLL
jgi:hypothetical protein